MAASNNPVDLPATCMPESESGVYPDVLNSSGSEVTITKSDIYEDVPGEVGTDFSPNISQNLFVGHEVAVQRENKADVREDSNHATVPNQSSSTLGI